MGEILRAVADEHPETESQLFAQDGGLNRYVNVYLNDEDVRVLGGLDTEVGLQRHAGHPARHGGRGGLDARAGPGGLDQARFRERFSRRSPPTGTCAPA